MRKAVWNTILFAIIFFGGIAFVLLRTIPREIDLEGQTVTVKFYLGKKDIDVTDAVVKPVPEDLKHDIIRTFGTSIGKKNSGHFANIKTKTRFYVYTAGKGDMTYFEVGDKKYLVDGISMP